MRYLLLSLFFALLTPSFAEDYKVVKLRWEAIDGAKSYVIQVSDTSTFENILLEEKTKDTRIEFDYDPSYKFARFAGVDKNGIRGEFSDPVAVETRLATASRGGNHVYVSVGYVNWTSSAIENFIQFPNYSLINKVLFDNLLQIQATNYTFNGSLSNQMKGRSIELGGNLSSKSGAWGHKISLRNVSAHPNNGFTLEQATGTTVYESHSFDPLQMYLLRYNLQFFPWMGSSNKTLKQLAFQGGVNLQKESFDSSKLYFFLNPSSLSSLAGFLPQKNQYKSQTDFLNLGMAYNYEINKLHEIQIKPKDREVYALMRRRETITAMQILGLPPSQI
ncbi:MAG: hypothetical protein N3A69_06065, partial [Leptospiraceae bacterium]|nr:hypothetical protein [Leptospiraceae bacterium]